MTIVCGTDFSESARDASLAAAAIAKRLGVTLVLAHAVHDREPSPGPTSVRLEAQAAELRSRFGLEVETVVGTGEAHEALLEVARTHGARLLVVSSLGAKKQHRWLLGSTAERVAQSSPVPVLVVRDAASLVAWAGSARPLRAMVGVELAETSKPALQWAASLRELGPCDLLVTQVAWPIGEHARLGVRGPLPLDHLQPELLGPLTRDLRAWVGELQGAGDTTFTVSPGWGRVDTHLSLLADESKVDLLVVGTHQRAGTARLWQGSVSRGVLHQSSCNVACIPRGEAQAGGGIPTFRHVLIPTDFSDQANRAVLVGYGLASAGGTVHLLHVITRDADADDLDPRDRLRALVPPGAIGRGIATELEVVREDDAAMAIWHAAGRLGVDAICMATRGRSGLSRVLLGSQAQRVLERSRRPVVLVPPEREP